MCFSKSVPYTASFTLIIRYKRLEKLISKPDAVVCLAGNFNFVDAD
jgi:hypothetical protein